jgi:hypothetical protein
MKKTDPINPLWDVYCWDKDVREWYGLLSFESMEAAVSYVEFKAHKFGGTKNLRIVKATYEDVKP